MVDAGIKPSNSMTLVDRLALRIKESEMGVFITEDELIELGREALSKAFFDPERKPNPNARYNGAETIIGDPLIVQMARAAFTPLITKRVTEMVEQMAKLPEFQQAIQEIAVASIPDLLLNYGRRLASETVRYSATSAVETVLERIRNGGLQQSNGFASQPSPDTVVGTEGRTLPPVV